MEDADRYGFGDKSHKVGGDVVWVRCKMGERVDQPEQSTTRPVRLVPVMPGLDGNAPERRDGKQAVVLVEGNGVFTDTSLHMREENRRGWNTAFDGRIAILAERVDGPCQRG